MKWVKQFYTKQNEWIGNYEGDVTAVHRKNATVIQRWSSNKTGSLLELGSGGGQNAAAAADLGYSVVAVEFVPAAVKNALQLASQSRKGKIHIVEGDFYKVEFSDPFDIICYWDGFGIGTDADQKKLLARIAQWLRPTGIALIEIYAPWYWSAAAGRQMDFGNVSRRYDFDIDNSRLLDRWWPNNQDEQAVTQSLRCYSPDELQLLVKGTGLVLESVESRGAFIVEQNQFVEDVPITQAMHYLAILKHENHRTQE